MQNLPEKQAGSNILDFLEQVYIPGIDMKGMVKAFRDIANSIAEANKIVEERNQTVQKIREETFKSFIHYLTERAKQDAAFKASQAELTRIAIEDFLLKMKEISQVYQEKNEEALDVVKEKAWGYLESWKKRTELKQADYLDLKVIEGIGPKVEETLKKAGILSLWDLAWTAPTKIKQILDEAEMRGVHDPTTWPDQAKLAVQGRWDDLKTMQGELVGGKIMEN